MIDEGSFAKHVWRESNFAYSLSCFYNAKKEKKKGQQAEIHNWRLFRKEIEDITCPRVDMNFIFEWSTRYISSWTREDKINIHKRECNILFII